MTTQALLARLEGVRSRGPRKWVARCPAHDDRSPSLSVSEVENKILAHCFGGCEPKTIVEAMGLTLADLFADTPESPAHQLRASQNKLDLTKVAFQFELGALDRRLRAEGVLNAVQGFHPDGLLDEDLDHLLNAVARAYDDRDRAEFLEAVADNLKQITFERTSHHAAQY